jgi:hypothetical protein
MECEANGDDDESCAMDGLELLLNKDGGCWAYFIELLQSVMKSAIIASLICF